MSVHSPRVTTDRLPDYSDIERFVGFSAWCDLPPAEKAVAIWRYITDRETGLFPVQGIYEDADPGAEFAFYDERDLTKVLNVHGHGYCGLLSPSLAGIYAHAGFEDARIVNMRENHHCVTEVFYDGGWHYFDVDLRGMLYKRDGTVADLEEACSVQELWTGPPVRFEPFYPLDDKVAMFESFAPCKLTRMYHWFKSGHTMDFALRPGESLIRFWEPQDGRWFHPWPNSGGFNVEFLKRRFAEEPRGLKCKHPGWSKWTHGNGLFSYAPQLSANYDDFTQGVYEQEGVQLTSRGVETKEGGRVSFEVRTPYIIVGRVEEMGPPVKIEEAAVVYYRSLGRLRLSVSTDSGLTWKLAGQIDHAGTGLVDLTPQVLGEYGYLVRFDFERGSGLAELALNTWVQVSPPSLPRLFAGKNSLRFAIGDRYGHATTVKEVRLNIRDPAQLERHLVKLDGDYEPLREDAKIQGEVVFKVDAKPGTRIKWFTAGGYFHTHLGKAAAETRNAIYYSVEGPDGPWTEVCRAQVPTWVEHWHCGMEEDAILEEPVETVYVKYVGDPGLNQVWIYAHCLEEEKQAGLQVTHGYEMEGEMREDSFTFTEDTGYEIDCATEPENRFIRFAVDSRPVGKK